uniref:Uncharacterized protein n=1 Tax=Arundo donax TaxID=35708 RepID=A0A0A9FHJ9_ARUDO
MTTKKCKAEQRKQVVRITWSIGLACYIALGSVPNGQT